MKNLLRSCLVLCCALLAFLPARAAGGPDAYGYTWIASTDGGGPVYNWVDITTRPGVQTVSGLADDNAAPVQIPIGMSFHYYWNDYTKVKVGSNGWISFDNPSNVASCFPTIPTSGGAADNLLAAYMCDLNFTGAGNPGMVYYWTNALDSFVISYVNVPYWVPTGSGWAGSNSFQIILNKADSSITYQYQTTNTANFQANAGCIDMTVGIENSTGGIGLQVWSDAVCPSSYAIRFDYPAVVLIAIQDPYPRINQNGKNGGFFVRSNSPFSLSNTVRNGGNTDVTTPTTVNAQILNLGLATQYSASGTIYTLNASQDSTLVYAPAASLALPGSYYYRSTTSNSADFNALNNTLNTEIVVLNTCIASNSLGYTTGTFNTGTINWNGGANDDGVGVYYEPPVYPYRVDAVDFFIASSSGTHGYTVNIYDDDGLLGAPGTLLHTGTVAPASVISGTWNTYTLPTGITLPDGGFYVNWMQGGTTVFIGTENTGPISRRNFEILDGAWAEYRSNTAEDFMIRATISNYPNMPTAAWTFNAPNQTVDFTDGSVGADTWLWDFGDGNSSTSPNPTHTYASGGTYSVCLTVNNACGQDSVCQTVTAGCAAPVAGFTYSGSGLSYMFIDMTTPSTPSTSWLWDFGDGGTSTAQNPMHSYATGGSYTICLTVTDSCGTDSTCQTFMVVCPTPSASFTYNVTGSGDVYSFTDNSASAQSWAWDFGDGGTSTQQNPSHTYTVDGQYYVCLTITDSCGSDSSCVIVNVLIVGRNAGEGLHCEIAPNPGTTGFDLSGVLAQGGEMRIRLLDLSGKVLLETTESAVAGSFRHHLDTPGIAAGAYLVEVQSGDTRRTLRWMKE